MVREQQADRSSMVDKGHVINQLAVLFDMDGTIYDSGIDFLSIRERLGLPQNGIPILEQLRDVSPQARTRGIELLHAAEAYGAANGRLIPGATELLCWLQGKGISRALITNNSRPSVEAMLSKHPLSFDLILTRDDAAAKPDPALFLKALELLQIQPAHVVAVGDTHLDALAAHRAGIREIHLVSLRDWMTELIPGQIGYKEVANLYDVRDQIGEWLKCKDVSRLAK